MTTTQAPVTASARCDAAVGRRSLLQHPFYVAWTEGTLPVPALKDYAREYGAFIRTVGQGWEMAGEHHIASVEEGHAAVWENTFASGLDTAVEVPRVPEVAALVRTATELFASETTALGALYAFESQQPFTAQSKLAGLQAHYAQLPECCGEYFRLHEDDFEEPELLAGKMNALTLDEQAVAVAACESLSQRLHDALSGLYAPYQPA